MVKLTSLKWRDGRSKFKTACIKHVGGLTVKQIKAKPHTNKAICNMGEREKIVSTCCFLLLHVLEGKDYM